MTERVDAVACGTLYLFGLAQANLELNAVFGICMAAFFFVPLYLRKGEDK